MNQVTIYLTEQKFEELLEEGRIVTTYYGYRQSDMFQVGMQVQVQAFKMVHGICTVEVKL